MQEFVGRVDELEQLHNMFTRGDARVVVIKGRRRIGKTRLVEEFAKGKKIINITGIAPVEGVTAQDERDEFCKQLSKQLGIPVPSLPDWTDIFHFLLDQLTDEPTVFFLDEISWMSSKDLKFIPKMKAWWDVYLCKRPNFMLIFCGSVSTWIEKNIVKSTSFFGRISLQLTMEPLSLHESETFLRWRGFKGSVWDMYRILCVTGGIPAYLDQIDSRFMGEENIQNLCFKKNGRLLYEFDTIFHDLFNGDSSVHKIILESLITGMKTARELSKILKGTPLKELQQMLDNLILCGFIKGHAQWSLKTRAISTQRLYGISDPYVQFYLKYIEPRRADIEAGGYQKAEITKVPDLSKIMGFAAETLLLHNRDLLLESIGIAPSDIVFNNPYYQKGTSKNPGCQVDYLIQTRSGNIFVCEFKFRDSEIGLWIIPEMEQKLNRLSIPRRTAAVPVLFHVGGVHPDLDYKDYFYKIVDISDFLKAV